MPEIKVYNFDDMKKIAENENQSPEEKMEGLKKDIAGLGYKVEEKENGEIKITE